MHMYLIHLMLNCFFKKDDVVTASTSRGTAIIYKLIVCNDRDLRWKYCKFKIMQWEYLKWSLKCDVVFVDDAIN